MAAPIPAFLPVLLPFAFALTGVVFRLERWMTRFPWVAVLCGGITVAPFRPGSLVTLGVSLACALLAWSGIKRSDRDLAIYGGTFSAQWSTKGLFPLVRSRPLLVVLENGYVMLSLAIVGRCSC